MQRQRTGTPMGGIVNAKREQRKIVQKQPKEKLYIYACKEGHQRTETVKLLESPICTNCVMRLGVNNRLEYIRTANRVIPKPKQKKRQKRK